MSSIPAGRVRSGSVLTGLLLVALGALLLLTNTGVVSFGIWIELATYWPALLLLTGMEIVLVRRPILIRAGVIALTLAIVVAAAYWSIPEYDPPEPMRASYVEPLGDAQRLQLSMAFLGGDVDLTSGKAGRDSFAGMLAADFGSRPSRVIREQSNRDVELYLASSGPFLRHSSYDDYTRRESRINTRRESRISFPVGLANWNLELSPDVESDIEIGAGATNLNLDLRDLNVRKLTIEAGVSDITIHLPSNAGQTHIDIAGGAAEVEILVPDNVAAHIDIDSPLGSTLIDPVRFIEIDDIYRSANFSKSRNRVWVDVEALSANVIVR